MANAYAQPIQFRQRQNEWDTQLLGQALSFKQQKYDANYEKFQNFMNNFANIEVLVTLENANKVSIYVNLTELSNQENKNFQFIWDASKNELIESIIL